MAVLCHGRIVSGRAAGARPAAWTFSMRMMRHCSLEHFQGVATIVFYDVSCELKRPILGASCRIDLVQRGSQTATNVRFGPEVDIRTAKSHVRFTPESGHVRCS
jgi:hypothetical protein